MNDSRTEAFLCGYCGFLARPSEIITNENGEPLVALVGTDIGASQKQRELCTALVEGAIALCSQRDAKSDRGTFIIDLSNGARP